MACGKDPVEVDPAVVSLASGTVMFQAIEGGGDPPSWSVEVDNDGGGELTGLGTTVTYTPPGTGWLKTPSWNLTSAPAVLTLQPSTGALTADTYYARVAVRADGATPDTLEVIFEVGPGPKIALSDSSVTFEALVGGVDPHPVEISIINSGGGALVGLGVESIEYGAGAPGWLMPPSLTSTSAPSTLTLLALTHGMVPGTHSASVQITGTNVDPVTVAVTFEVAAPPPILALSASTLRFVAREGDEDPEQKSVDVLNARAGPLTGLAVESVTYDPPGVDWLGIPQLSSSEAPSVLTLAPQIGSLNAGTYQASVVVVGQDVTSRTLTVTFDVEPPPPVMVLSTRVIDFDAIEGSGDPTPQVVQITNGGGSPLSGLAIGSVTYDPPGTNWLGTPALSSGTAPSELTLAPEIGSLDLGTYAATVRVQGVGAAPDSIEVMLEILPAPPRIAVAPDEVDLSVLEGGVDPPARIVAVTNGGGQTLTGLAVTSIAYDPPGASWLDASLANETAPTELTLTAHTQGLTAGTYAAEVEVTGTDVGVATVDVALEVLPSPAVGASPSEIGFVALQSGPDPDAKVVNIENVGTGTLGGLAIGPILYDPPGNWLGTPTLLSEQAPSVLTLWPVTDELAVGVHRASVVVTGVAARPDTIFVTLDKLPSYSLSVVVGDSTGDGRVTGGAIDCEFRARNSFGACLARVASDSIVTLTATAAPGHTFVQWLGDCTGSGPCVVTMDGHKFVAVDFAEPPTVPLVVLSGGGDGYGIVYADSLGYCFIEQAAQSGGCSADIRVNTEVSLTATADPGNSFAGWGGDCMGEGECNLTMSETRNVTATFTANPPVELTVASGGGNGDGLIASSTYGISCEITGSTQTGSCSESINGGMVVTLTAWPDVDSGAEFGGWGGACSGMELSCEVTMSEARSVTARFVRIFALTIRTGGGLGNGTVTGMGLDCSISRRTHSGSCDADIELGTTVTLNAAPVTDHTFTGWGGACTGTAPCSFEMSEASEVTAVFASNLPSYELTITTGGGNGEGTVYGTTGDDNDESYLACIIELDGATPVATHICSEPYTSETVVMLTASPDLAAQQSFVGWGGACSGTSPTCTVTMSQAQTVTAKFNATSLQELQAGLFSVHCMACHGTDFTSEANTLSYLSQATAYTLSYPLATTYPQRVVPYDALQSYVYRQVVKSSGAWGMPISYSIDPTLVAKLRSWIDGGARAVQP